MVVRPEEYREAALAGTYLGGKPLFVIEVVSPTERKSRRLQKVGLYLEAGAGAIVEIDYVKRRAYVYRPEEEVAELVSERIHQPFSAELSDIFQQLG